MVHQYHILCVLICFVLMSHWSNMAEGKPVLATTVPTMRTVTKPHLLTKDKGATIPTTTKRTVTTLPTTKPMPSCGQRPMMEWTFGSRIVGGSEAIIGSWPWIVSIQQPTYYEGSYFHLCGGVLLNTHWVLTAAHCFAERNDEWKSWRLVFGAHYLSDLDRVQIRRIVKKIDHESYDPETEKNDISLLYVDDKVKFGDNVQPACLPAKTAAIDQMTECHIAGWGLTHEDASEPSEVLMTAQVELIPNKVCNKRSWHNGAVREFNLCAGYEEGGIDTCQGDSGGPLMCRVPGTKTFFVVGITSWGYGCAEARSPGVYTATQNYLHWINIKTS